MTEDISNAVRNLPSKKWFQIREVAEFCSVKQSVLRYWEREFECLNIQRRSNRRYYTKEDILDILRIKALLYEQGMTVRGAQQVMSGKVIEMAADLRNPTIGELNVDEMIVALDDIKTLLRSQ